MDAKTIVLERMVWFLSYDLFEWSTFSIEERSVKRGV